MIKIGDYNTLKIVKEVDFGIYLDGGEYGEILMPKKYVPKNVKPDDEIEAFVYNDTEDRLIATTETPKAKVNEFAFLKVTSLSKFGAFMDWGLIKELLVPFREQKVSMEKDRWYIVYIYLDTKTNRLAASAKLNKFISTGLPVYDVNDEVNILIENETEIGYKAIVDNRFWGLLFKNELFSEIKKGDKLKAYIKNVRTDTKIDLSLQKTGYESIDEISDNIYQELLIRGGNLSLNDKSSPEEIKEIFGISKKVFKKAIGSLYKKRIIEIHANGIRLKKT